MSNPIKAGEVMNNDVLISKDTTSPGFIVLIPPDPIKVLGNIVFLHGLDGNGSGTWTSKNGAFWPRWLIEDKGYLGVYVANYNTSSTKWKKSSLPIIELANEVLHLMEAEVSSEIPIIFICHSLGGLLAKQVLRRCNDSSNGDDKNLLAQTKGIVFLATPHHGSKVANVINTLKFLRETSLVNEMKSPSTTLQDLSFWFRENLQRLNINIVVFYEKKRTYVFKIVDEISADPGIVGVNPVPVEKNHIDICKFVEKSSTTYKTITNFIDETIKRSLLSSIEIRNKELELASRSFKLGKSVNAIIVYGSPGIGKTFFTHSIAESFGCSKLFMVSVGEEKSPHTVAKALLTEGLEQLMTHIVKTGYQSIEAIPEEELLQCISQAIATSNGMVVVERLDYADFSTYAFWQKLIRETPKGRLSYIINSYVPVTGFDTAIHYQLENLSFEDGVKLLLQYDDALSLDACISACSDLCGHPYSLVSWVKSPIRQKGLPHETRNLYKRIFDSIPQESQKVFLCICKEPRFLQIIPEEKLLYLYGTGLLSKYPSLNHQDRIYYVHDISVNSLASEMLHFDEEVYAELISEAERLGHPWAGPKKVECLLRYDKKEDAENSFIDGGRNWVETIGLQNMSEIITNIKMFLDSSQFAYVFSRYLEGLIFLFSGAYDEAKNLFEWLQEEYKNTIPQEVLLAFKAETLECDRRLGKAPSVMPAFNNLLQLIAQGCHNQHHDSFSVYFEGVTYFVIGHFFRHFSELDEAIRFYEKAEKCFLSTPSKSNEIEVLHCLYVKTLCQPAITTSVAVTTKSFFIDGLLASIRFKRYLSSNDLELAEVELTSAKSAFRSFGSPHYYKRCLVLEVILHLVQGKDFASTELFRAFDPKSKKDRTYYLAYLLHEAVRRPVTNNSALEEGIVALAKSGNYLTILALIEIAKLLTYPVDDQFKFEYTYLKKESENYYSCQATRVTIREFTSSMIEKSKLENISQAIYLFD